MLHDRLTSAENARRAGSPPRLHHPHHHHQIDTAKTIAAWALGQVIGHDRTYARWVSTWGEPRTLARIP